MKSKTSDVPRGIRLTTDDERYLKALKRKYPEMNYSTLIRRAVRELAQKEQVA